MLKKIGSWLARDRVSTALIVVAASLVWFFLTLHAGPLAPVLGWVDFQSASWIVLVAAAVLLVRRPNCFTGLYGIALAWFMLFFMQAWSTGVDTLCTAKVLIPIGDCAGYSFEASHLAHGQTLSDWGGHHLLSHSLFSSLTFLFNHSAACELLAMGLLAALSLSLCTMAVSASFGAFAAAAFMVLCGQFFHGTLGGFGTETYGLSMGLLGTALILTGLRIDKRRWQLVGIFVLGIALVARMGAFFVLPLSGLAVAIAQPTWRRRIVMLAAAAACVVAAMALNGAAMHFFCDPRSAAMGTDDFWHNVDGTLTGRSWHASITTQSAQAARAECVRIVLDNPGILFANAWHAIRFFFAEHVAYSFLPWRWLVLLMPWMLAGGAACCLIRIRERVSYLLLLCIAGIILSVPFVPPWDVGIRPYAATIPLQVLGAVVLVGFLTDSLRRRIPERIRSGERQPLSDRPGYAAGLAAFVLVLGLGLPLVMSHTPLHLGKVGSAYYEGRMWVRIIPGNYLRIVKDGDVRHSYLPFIRHSDFVREQNGFSTFFRADDTAVYSRMPEGVLVTRGDATGMVFVIKDDFGPTPPESVELDASLVHLRGDNVAYDKRLGIDPDDVYAILESVYLPWFDGYDYYYRYHPALGMMTLLENIPRGRVTMETQKFGILETSKLMFPRFRRQSDGKMLRINPDTKTLVDDATGEAVK